MVVWSCTRRLDDNGDGVWTLTVERAKGFSSYYTFTNGACPDYSCKENIAGQDCANPDNFNDRNFDPVQNDTIISTCFGLCANSADECGGASPGNVTFQVDMNDYMDPFTQPYLSGSFNGWSGDGNPLDDTDGDGIWSTTLFMNPGNYEYKFSLDNWSPGEEFTDANEPCVMDFGGFINRVLAVDGDTTVCFKWNTCVTCDPVGVNEVVFNHNMFELRPNLVDQFTTISFGKNTTSKRLVRVYNTTGNLIFQQSIEGGVSNFLLNTASFQKGIYLVNVLEGGVLGTQKMLKL